MTPERLIELANYCERRTASDEEKEIAAFLCECAKAEPIDDRLEFEKWYKSYILTGVNIEHLREGAAYIYTEGDRLNIAYEAWQAARKLSAPVVPDELIHEAASRFLGWRLPKDFSPDAGIKFAPSELQVSGVHPWPIGTNLLNATQADAMFKYCLEPLLVQPAKAAPNNIFIPKEYAKPHPHGFSAAAYLEQVGYVNGWNACRATVIRETE